MPAPSFIAKNSLGERILLREGNRLAVEGFDRLRERLTIAVGREVAGLFGEPVLNRASGTGEVSWYTHRTGDVLLPAALDTAARTRFEATLRAFLSGLEPLLADREIGSLLARALYVASAEDILAVGVQPVLTNWGMLPLDIAAGDRAAVERHFRETLGPYAPFPAPSIEEAVAGKEVACMDDEPVEGSSREARRLLVALAVAAGVLLLLTIPGVLATARPDQGGGGSEGDASALIRQQEDINRALAEKIALTRKAIDESVCQKDGGVAPDEGLSIPPRQARVQRKGQPASKETLNDLVDSSAVFILVSTEKGSLTTGSGFFVNDRTIVTNRHVVEEAKAVRVTNKQLGRLTPASVLATTKSSTPGEPDFAALSIEVERAPPPVPLSATVSRLLDVLAAGYPGTVTSDDPEFDRLKKGDASAVPPSTITQGVINHIYGAGGDLPYFLHSANMAQGNSGGPLLDACGRAVGINTFVGQSDALVEDEANPGKMKKVPAFGYGAYFSLGTKGLKAFLDANGVGSQSDDTPCRPESVAEAKPGPASGPVPGDPAR